MLQLATSSLVQAERVDTSPSRRPLLSSKTVTEEWLPFTVKVVNTKVELAKAVQIRHDAYARHLPEFAETLSKPEAADFEKGVVVLVAESKEDGSPVGTMRIQTNAYKPLVLEQSIDLPDWLKVLPMAEATRLGVTNEKGGRLVTTALFKAYYMYCKQIGIEWMVIAGRSPIDRQYQRMLFDDVFPGRGFIPLAHASNLPHRVMSSCVKTAETRWTDVGHPLFDFAFRTHHPDIMLDTPRRPLTAPSGVPVLPSMSATLPIQPPFPAAGGIYAM